MEKIIVNKKRKLGLVSIGLFLSSFVWLFLFVFIIRMIKCDIEVESCKLLKNRRRKSSFILNIWLFVV